MSQGRRLPQCHGVTLRSSLLVDIKRAATELVDERGVQPVLLVDDAHLLHDDTLRELAVLLDGRDLRS